MPSLILQLLNHFGIPHFTVIVHRATKPMAPTVAVKILEPAGIEAAGYWGMSSSIYAKDGVMGGDFFRCRKKNWKQNPEQRGKEKNWEDLEVWMGSKAVYICFFQPKHRNSAPMVVFKI